MTSEPSPTTAPQRFGPTSGVVSGWIGVVSGTVLAGWMLLEEPDAAPAAFLVLVAVVLCWAFLLRPRVLLHEGEVELRNPVSAWHIPLASVEDILVRQTTMVRARGKRYVGVGVGHPLRKLVRTRPAPEFQREMAPDPTPAESGLQLIDFMVERIQWLSKDARRLGAQPGPVRRSWAVPELVAVGLLLLAAVVVSFL